MRIAGPNKKPGAFDPVGCVPAPNFDPTIFSNINRLRYWIGAKRDVNRRPILTPLFSASSTGYAVGSAPTVTPAKHHFMPLNQFVSRSLIGGGVGRRFTIKLLAEAEQVAERYIGKLLQLTLLAPDIIEAALDGRLPRGVGLADFMKPWTGVWAEQRAHLHELSHGNDARPK